MFFGLKLKRTPGKLCDGQHRPRAKFNLFEFPARPAPTYWWGHGSRAHRNLLGNVLALERKIDRF